MRRVIKVGGSLLTRRDLITALPNWIAAQPPAENLCLVGGGQLIDAIRRLDELHPGDPEKIHWLCVGLLQVTHEWVASWFNWTVIDAQEDFDISLSNGFSDATPTLVAPSAFYRFETNSQLNVPLPNDWRTTTDSIAAWLAIRCEADELVLLKSCQVDAGATPQQLADQGVVDEYFPTIAPRVPSIRIERLRPELG
jgi:aspartokinase-like uncharacterized kinase